MRGFAKHLIGFPDEFNKFDNTEARMQDSIYHMTVLITFYLRNISALAMNY